MSGNSIVFGEEIRIFFLNTHVILSTGLPLLVISRALRNDWNTVKVPLNPFKNQQKSGHTIGFGSKTRREINVLNMHSYMVLWHLKDCRVYSVNVLWSTSFIGAFLMEK